MALAIGIFPSEGDAVHASQMMRRFGITSKDVAIVATDEGAQTTPIKPLFISGFLADYMREGGIRTVGTDIVIQMVREGIGLKDAFKSLEAIKKGYKVLAARTPSTESPWIAELMRRSGAVEAHDSETETDMKEMQMAV